MSAFPCHDPEKRDDIPTCAKASGCDKTNCPGPRGFDTGYGLAGGGMGVYRYCQICEQIRGKDCEPA